MFKLKRFHEDQGTNGTLIIYIVTYYDVIKGIGAFITPHATSIICKQNTLFGVYNGD